LVVVTGLSGSGKSSLAFDTIFAEANRRYVESLSSYARHFMDGFEKPDVDIINNLSPAISIDQKSVSRSPRSTVGTMTEVYDFLRILFTKAGVPHCPTCHKTLARITVREVMEELLLLPDQTPISILAHSDQTDHKSEKEALEIVERLGYVRIRRGQEMISLADAVAVASLGEGKPFDIVIDRLLLDQARPDKERLLDSLATAFALGKGTLSVVQNGSGEQREYNNEYRCGPCHVRLPEYTPSHFSFNNPEGACPKCTGLGRTLEFDAELILPNRSLSITEGAIRPWSKLHGERQRGSGPLHEISLLAKRMGFSLTVPVKKLSAKQVKAIIFGEDEKAQSDGQRFRGVIYFLEEKYRETKSDHLRQEIEGFMQSHVCPACQGKRLQPSALAVTVLGYSLADLVNMSTEQLLATCKDLQSKMVGVGKERDVMTTLFREIESRLRAVEKVGLGYLELCRGADTLSGGEAQRIRLSVQMKSGLSGIIYVLDEPSVGLHSRDTDRLIQALLDLKEANNSLVIVEHDVAMMRQADYIIDLGPGAGPEGGEIIFAGTPEKLMKSKVLTGEYLSGTRQICRAKQARKWSGESIVIEGATEHNLKNIDCTIPLGMLVSIAGVSGSGKSSLIHDILSRALAQHFYRAKTAPGSHKKITGLSYIDKVITVNQDPIGRTPRSNAATYTGVFSLIRDVFAETKEAEKARFSATHFSFNMRGGRCEICQGGGLRKIEMYLLPDVYAPCEACNGTRYNTETLAIQYRGTNISQVLAMTVSEARRFFLDQPAIEEKLRGARGSWSRLSRAWSKRHQSVGR
jgi:excinuclease ABC subunit A